MPLIKCGYMINNNENETKLKTRSHRQVDMT